MLKRDKGVYRTKVTKKQSRFYFLLSIIFIGVMIKWGVPGLINFIANSGADTTNASQETDTIPPQRPVLSALPDATNSASLHVTGYTEAGAEAQLWLNDSQRDTIKTNDNGEFDFLVSLSKGDNSIRVKARDEAGNESDSGAVAIIYDQSQLEITVDSPTEGAMITGRDNKNTTVRGKIDKTDARLTINGAYTRVDSEGNFSQQVVLSEGDNQIKIVATDTAGNQTEKIVNVKFYP